MSISDHIGRGIYIFAVSFLMVICVILIGLCFTLRFFGIKKIFGHFIMERDEKVHENIISN